MPPLNTFDKTIIALALGNSLASAPLHAATINIDAGCTLSQAILSANNGGLYGTCELGDAGPDIIAIPNQTIALSAVHPDGYQYGDSGLPLITSEITIQGNGSTIEATNPADCYVEDCFRIMATEAYNLNANLTLESITLTGGDAAYFGGSYQYGYGGAVYVGAGTSLNMSHVTLENNFSGYSGGALYAGRYSQVEINQSSIESNYAVSSGGGIGLGYSESLTIVDSSISLNSTGASIGAGQKAGGIYGYRSGITIVNSTLSNNNAVTSGSAIYLNASSLALTNSTISDNLNAPSLQLAGNGSYSASATLVNSVVANSPAGLDCAVTGTLAYAVITATNSNWIEGATCNGVASGDPMLAVFSNNGGPTRTHLPNPGSGLLDNADPAACPSTDQRGEVRDIGDDSVFFQIIASNGNIAVVDLGGEAGQCDIGAVELPAI